MNSYEIGDKVELRHKNGIVSEIKDGWVSGATGEKFLYSSPHYIVTFTDGTTGEALAQDLKPVTATEEELEARRQHIEQVARRSEDVSLESALAASKRPELKTEKVKVFDYELGWVEEWVTVEVEHVTKPGSLDEMNSNWKPYQDISKDEMQLLVDTEVHPSALLAREVKIAQSLVDRGFIVGYHTDNQPIAIGNYMRITEAGKQYLQDWRKNYRDWMTSNFS
jgi:hypothetical protein